MKQHDHFLIILEQSQAGLLSVRSSTGDSHFIPDYFFSLSLLGDSTIYW